MIYEPMLELSMSSSSRYKSHLDGSDRHLHGEVQAVLHGVPQGVMSSWHILKTFLTEEDIMVYSNGWNPLSSRPQIRNIKKYHSKKREASKEKASVASISKPQVNQPPQEGKKNKKKNRRKPYSPSYRIPKNSKGCHGQCLQHGQTFYGIQGQGGTKNETTPFPKQITLSCDVVNTLTELQESILPLKDMKKRLLSLQEIDNSLSSLTKIVVQNKKESDNIKFMVENKKPKVLIDNTQKLIQGQQELYKYIKDIKHKTLTINYDVSIDNLTKKLNKLSISVEKFEKKTSSHQKLLSDHVEKGDEARIHVRDDIKS
ncbi:hypothetical protein O181_110146 [Austropuccinia psidii MF-1]|uniref:Uncharacterized protein n=1 Tax=Austropuccinia psidii MF-1 TaxID=1389203 RepID=A0A9Q3JYL6_9BASI|nr:hypothetical protein [Austropuccinia psidii MF-1]